MRRVFNSAGTPQWEKFFPGLLQLPGHRNGVFATSGQVFRSAHMRIVIRVQAPSAARSSS
jgi:hypothetical protein